MPDTETTWLIICGICAVFSGVVGYLFGGASRESEIAFHKRAAEKAEACAREWEAKMEAVGLDVLEGDWWKRGESRE